MASAGPDVLWFSRGGSPVSPWLRPAHVLTGGGEFLAQTFLQGSWPGTLDVVFQITVLQETLSLDRTVSRKAP